MTTSAIQSFASPWTLCPDRLGLGLGLDLPWGVRTGFERTGDADRVTPKVRRFFDQYRDRFAYVFLAFQPRNRDRLEASDYFAAYDDFFDAVGPGRTRALHQTMFNMGVIGAYDRSDITRFTNSVTKRYGLKWVVEDVGIWSIDGKVMPYPLPPILTELGLANCIRNVRDVASRLDAPLSIEFPGFTEGSNFFIGKMHAFEFFSRLATETDIAVTLDVGHLLSYQWLRGRTGAQAHEELDLLPLDRCFELHLSGCSIVGGKFRDAHHGVLLDEQILLLEELLIRCPRLCAVTYEDPQFDDEGFLIPKSVRNFDRLVRLVENWVAS